MLKVRQIKIPIDSNNKDYILKKISNKLKCRVNEIINYKITKLSIDARDKNNLLYVYEFDVEVLNEKVILNNSKTNDITISDESNYSYEITGSKKLDNRIVVVGSGPCGLLCSYMLAEAGYNPLILERGEKIEDRVNSVEEFFENNNLNINSNIQFGEGGAGTFSDGKLNTLVKDKLNRGKRVFEIFIENGAPEEIMYLSKPHIGTDILRKVIINMRNKIISMGGEFRYSSCVTDIDIKDNKVCGVTINDDEYIKTDVVVLAIGHSARDTFYMLHNKGINMKAKNFAVGVRIEHPQEMINISQYGTNKLGAANYKLTYQTSKGRGVYSFCMCPGGFVVNASSEEGHLVVNGMSNFARNERNSNSAIVVTVSREDFGDDCLSGIEFQRKLESNAYKLGKGLIPIQLYGDYKNNIESTNLGEVIPNVKGKYNFSDLNKIFPDFINEALKEGIDAFEKKIKGFSRSDAILLGVESRTSSPVIIERGEDFEASVIGLYPCGEGAGYAGGITTAAIDGVKVFESIISKYSNK